MKKRVGRWGSVHTHSHFSSLDAMATVKGLVKKAAEMGHPYMTLTDHGNMAGAVQLYEAGKEFGVKVFPGVEIYLLDPAFDGELEKSSTAKRFHSCIAARNLEGYQALVKYVSLTHTRPRFSRFPRGTLSDLAELGQKHGDGLIFTTGCVFGLVQQTLINEGRAATVNLIRTLNSWFPHFFIELQNHGITHEDGTTDMDLVIRLHGIAKELGIPVIAAPDTHYLNSQDSECHSMMKAMVYGSIEDSFPGGPYHLPSEEWMSEQFPPGIWADCLDGSDLYLSLHDLVIPPLDNFKAQVPKMVADPDKKLRRVCEAKLEELVIDRVIRKHKVHEYEELLTYELDVIAHVGQGNYFLFMDMIVSRLRSQGVFMDARGSASGSLVCWLLGLTQVDPIFWGTDFDRFMAKDRIAPPDIDMDIEDVSRHLVLDLLSQSFDTMQIGTFLGLGKTVDMNTGLETGSVFQTYLTYLRRVLEAAEFENEEKLAEREGRKPVKYKAVERAKERWYKGGYDQIKSMDDVKRLSLHHWRLLQRMSDMSLHKSYGVHAAGVLISGEDMKIADWVPSMLVASSNTTVSQFTMQDVEKLGFMKGDWLGQTSLTVMRRCQELIGRRDPTDFRWIPLDDKDTMKACREFRQDTGIFHLEGWTKGKGAKALNVQNVEDLVRVQALFMPGAMNSGATDLFVERNRSIAARKRIRYSDPLLEKVLGPTHGVLIYQEQVLDLARGVGLDGKELQDFFKIIKKASDKNPDTEARMRHAEETFTRHAKDYGMSKTAISEAWNYIESMGGYGFNRAHAVAYGIRSYRTAYLKTHYPIEYMTALLSAWEGRPKEAAYVKEARRIGIPILPAMVNISGMSWSLDPTRQAIRKGLISIDGVGAVSAMELEEHAPYKSLEDLASRVNPRKVSGAKGFLETGTLTGVLGKLDAARALDVVKGIKK